VSLRSFVTRALDKEKGLFARYVAPRDYANSSDRECGKDSRISRLPGFKDFSKFQ